MSTFLQDLRYAARALRRSPGFALVAVLTLALGIGANTTIFNIANWVLLRPIPGIADPEELAVVQFQKDDGNSTGISYPNLVDLREAAPALSGLVGSAPASLQVSAENAEPLSLFGEAVTGGYFRVLGVRPQHGRWFLPEELGPGSEARVAVISDRLWHSFFEADPGVVGRTLRLNGSTFTIVGVAPKGFHGTERLGDTDVWLPGPTYPVVRHMSGLMLDDRGAGMFMNVVGRLRPGASLELAQEQLQLAMRRLVEGYPEANDIYGEYRPTVFSGIGIPIFLREQIGGTMRLLMGIVALVLLIACANVANLLIFRGVRRRGETAVRRALGASWNRLLRQSLVEGVLLALLGGAGGVLVAIWLTDLFRGFSLLGLPPLEEVGVDWRVLGFALLVSIATGIFFGIVPAAMAQREDLVSNLKESSRTETGRGARLRGALTVVQLTASMALLVGALLLARTLHNLSRVDLGFDAEEVLTFSVNPEPQGYSPEQVRALRDRLLDRVGEIPGIESVSLIADAPFSRISTGIRVRAGGGDAAREPLDPNVLWIAPDYFTTLGIPLLAGRDFTRAEYNASPESAPDGVVISRNLAIRLFGEENPLGKRVIEDAYEGPVTYQVIGVAADTRTTGLRNAPDPLVYRPLAAAWNDRVAIMVRSARPDAETETAVREAVSEIDSSLPFFRVETLSESVRGYMAEERLFSRMIGLLALLAAVLAGVGLYSVIAYSVAQRTREIGIRMALGAESGRVVGLVAREAGGLVIAGAVIGTAAAAGFSRLLESRLFGVEPLDPAIYFVAGILFLLVTLAASTIPARAATRVDPMVALRAE